MFYDFQITKNAKWILAGEHAVVRGHSALVFPVKTKTLCLSYTAETNALSATYSGESGQEMHLLFWSVLEQGIKLLNKSINHLTGHFHLKSNIPIGVGLGASAALCAATANWFNAQNLITDSEIFSFAKKLENLFHGESSGLDIAGASSDSGIYFNQGNYQALQNAWQPLWFLSSCNQIGITSHCIEKVKKLWETNRSLAKDIDMKMLDAVIKARAALIEINLPKAEQKLANAITQAKNCFELWGLVNDNLQQHMDDLIKAGAIATKPTGSGGGGYVVSLWKETPPQKLLSSLIPI